MQSGMRGDYQIAVVALHKGYVVESYEIPQGTDVVLGTLGEGERLPPESATSVLVFARLPYAGLGKRIMAWPLTAKWQTDAKRWTVQDVPDKPVIDIEVPVGDEPIRVFGDRRELFFVTASGKCYSATRGNDHAYRIQTLWADPDRPIVAFVGDTDRGRTFAFTQSAGLGGSVYFELRVPIQPVPCPHPVPNLQNVDASILVQLAKIIPGGPVQPK